VVTEFATRRVQPWVFVLLAFDGTRFTSVRPLGHQIGGQSAEQFDPQLLGLSDAIPSGLPEASRSGFHLAAAAAAAAFF
jgi:hypothetical protein